MKTISLAIMAIFYVGAGTLHFIKPGTYLKIMPPRLPNPLALVYLSGAAEITLGAALLVPALRAYAAWGVMVLLLAVFPANVYMYLKGEKTFRIPGWILFLRLPLQFMLMYWAFTFTN